MRTIILAVLTSCLAGSPWSLAKDETQRSTIMEILNAYMANLAALNEHGAITFAYYHGTVDGTGEATPENLASRPRNRLSEGHGRYIFAGKKRLYDHSYPVEQHRKNTFTSPNGKSNGIFGYRWVGDGQQVIIDDMQLSQDLQALNHRGSIRSTINRMWIDGYMETPINPGRNGVPAKYSFVKVLTEHLNNARQWNLRELNENDRIGETQATKIVMVFEEEGVTWQCWVDRARGSIPLRLHVTDKEQDLIWSEENLDLRSLADGAWIPYHWLHFSGIGLRRSDDNDPKPQTESTLFWEGEIESADLEVVPDDSEFYLDFPEAISIRNTDGGPAYPESVRWDLNSISPEATAAALQLPVNQNLVYRPPTRWFPWLPEREWWQNGLLFLAIGLFSLYGGWVYFRSRRQR